MALEFKAVSDTGRIRETNEDCYIAEPELGLLAVADGMGGQAAGEVASRIAVDTIVQFIKLTHEQRDITWPVGYDTSLNHNKNRLRTALILANKEIFIAVAEDAGLHGMGTTAVCGIVEGNCATLAHAGDSRAYLYRGGELKMVTRDHSWVSEQVHRGVISEDQARGHPLRNVVTRALGAHADVEVELNELTLQPGDLLMLCTDGLTSMLDDQEISGILSCFGEDLASSVQALVFEANRKGGEDNITVILSRFLPD